MVTPISSQYALDVPHDDGPAYENGTAYFNTPHMGVPGSCTICQKNRPITQILLPLVEKRMSVSGVCPRCLEKHSAVQPSFYQRQLGLSELGIGGGKNRCIPFEPIGSQGQTLAFADDGQSIFKTFTKTLWLLLLVAAFVFVCYMCYKMLKLQTRKTEPRDQSSASSLRLPTVQSIKSGSMHLPR